MAGGPRHAAERTSAVSAGLGNQFPGRGFGCSFPLVLSGCVLRPTSHFLQTLWACVL